MNPKGQALKEAYEKATKAAQDAWGEFTTARDDADTKGTISKGDVFQGLTEKHARYTGLAEESKKAQQAYLSFLESGSANADNLGSKARLFGDWPSKLSDSFIEGAGVKAFDVTSGGTATTPFYDLAVRIFLSL
jgi:hypothetical protein